MPASPADLPLPPADPAPASAVLVDVVVLSGDLDLYQATRDAVGERNPVWRARTASESVDLLLTGRCGVLLLDMAAVSVQPAALIRQIVDQFPDVVVVVAGRREDETRLGPLVSDGLVYRFMHKPLSPKRAGMFLGAAIRSYAERRDGRARLRLLPQVGRLRRKLDPHKWLFVGGGLLLFLALLGALLTSRHGATDRTAPLPAATASRPAPRPTAARSDPVLSAARAARAAGRYEAPPGRNALDLYKAVLLARGDHPEARAGLAAITALLTERAGAAAAAGNEAEARRLARRVLDADPGHAGARQLLARLEARPAPSPPPVAASGPDATPTTTPPATAAARDARASAEAPAATGIVRPDPLTPRIVGHAATVRAAASRGGRSRSFGAPIDSGHAIAGFVAPATATAAIRPDDPAVDSGSAVAGVESRDLTTLATPAPEYPAQALRAHVEGWVEVEFTVDERGATADILVAGSEPAGVFDAAATTAVAGWRYLPRVVNGRTVPQRTSVTLRFSVED